jgi:hypothetical protein
MTPIGFVQTATFQTLVKVERSILSKRLELRHATYKYHSYIERPEGKVPTASVQTLVKVERSILDTVLPH